MLASLFAVPQISVWLNQIPPAHRQTLHFWLDFWRAHRDVLLNGELTPHQPHLGFPVVEARTAQKQIVAIYDDVIATLETAPVEQLLVVNAGFKPRVILECSADFGPRAVKFFDLNGKLQSEQTLCFNAGVLCLPIAECGFALCQNLQSPPKFL